LKTGIIPVSVLTIQYRIGNTNDSRAHDYYSIWFNFTANFFISERKV
jgi:hypothetical protein